MMPIDVKMIVLSVVHIHVHKVLSKVIKLLCANLVLEKVSKGEGERGKKTALCTCSKIKRRCRFV